jgi:hypothetical protein
MLRCSPRFLSTLAFVTAIGCAHAAELGEVRVSSHVGQPLVADIELALVDDPAAPVSVRLASPEVYNGAGIAMPPVLASVNLSVMKRDGRQFLHVTSLRPVEGEHLHLYLELADKGQRTVRLATLWLTPDPNPAPAPAAAPVSVPVPVPATAALHAAAVVAHAEPAPAPAPAPVPARPQPRPAASKVHAAPKAAAPAPLPIHASLPAAPAVCAQQAEQAKVCAALDGKNAALTAKIGKLEGKVQALQRTLGAPATSATAPESPAPAEAAASASASSSASASASASAEAAAEPASVPAGPKPISAIKPLVPRKPKAPPAAEPDPVLPWGWIGSGAALLLALGGTLLLLRRRARTVRNVDMPAEPHLIERLRQRFAARTKPAVPAPASAAPELAEEAVEPSFD